MLQRAIHPVAWQSDARAVEPLIYSLTECSVNYFIVFSGSFLVSCA